MIVIDSSIWDAAKNGRDADHDLALDILGGIAEGEHGEPIVTDYIIDEVLTWLNKKVSHKVAVDAGRVFLETTQVRVEKVDWAVIREAYELFKKYPFLSFTDSATAAIMRALKIRTIATFDDDFKKLGFRVIGG